MNTTVISLPPFADLEIIKTGSTDTLFIGDNITYTLIARNNGPEIATSVNVTDVLPGSLKFVSASTDNGTASELSGNVTWEIGDLAVGSTANLTIVATALPYTGLIINAAFIYGNELDILLGNNIGKVDTTVWLPVFKRPDISVTPTSLDFDSVNINTQSNPRTVTITNTGTADLEITDITIDNGLFTIVANNASGGTVLPGESIVMLLVFSPTSTGLQTATMSIYSSDPDENPVTISLTGTGSGGGGGGGFGIMAVEPMYFIVDFLGKITQELADEDGRPVKDITATSPDGLYILEIRQDTAAADAEGNPVMLVEIRYVTALQLPENMELIGRAFEFRPLDTTFDQIIKLTLTYDINELPENMTFLGMAYYDASQGWTYLTTTDSVEDEMGKLTASINHLGIYAVLAQVAPPIEPEPEPEPEPVEPPEPTTPEPPAPTPEPASFQLSNLSIVTSSETTKVGFTAVTRTGEEATISVDVTNIGGESGSYMVTLMVNGNEQGSQEVILGPGQTQTVTFSLGPNEPGSYMIEIGNLSGSFISELLINWWLFGGLIAFIVIVGGGIWFFFWRRNRGVSQET